MQEAETDTWSAMLGPNSVGYLGPLRRWQASGGHWIASWNWAAFFCSTGWFISRRMYVYGIANLLAALIAGQLFRWFDWDWLPPYTLGDSEMACLAAYLAGTYVVLPIFANAIYFRWLARRHKKGYPGEIAPNGTSELLGMLSGLLAFMVVPASFWIFINEMASRAAVGGAIALSSPIQKSVTEFYARHGRLPDARETASMSLHRPGKEARSVLFDPDRKAVVVTIAELNAEFREKEYRLALMPEARAGQLHWRCRPINLSRRYVPARCKDE